jgi:hypothetical protein
MRGRVTSAAEWFAVAELSSPSPQRGEGRGEGVRSSVVTLLAPSPGALVRADLSPPGRGEDKMSRGEDRKMSRTRKMTELIHEGRYAAEVPVELIEDDTAWSPYLSPEDVRKLDTVRLALKRGDVAEAAKHGRVFELKPVAAE